MPKEQPEDALRNYAIKSLKKKADFKQYLWVYLAVSLLVSAIWFFTTPEDYFWPIWLIFGMGIGALFGGLDAYGKLSSKPITDADIAAELERLKRKG